MKDINCFQEEPGAVAVISQCGSGPQPVATFDTSVAPPLDITPSGSKSSEATTLAVSQATATSVSPVSPKEPTLTMSHVTAIDISPATPKAPTMTISPITSFNIRPTTLQAPSLAISQVEAIFDYQPCENARRSESCSGPPDTTHGILGTAIPIITDTNHGLPIVIDDTDDEMRGDDAGSRTNGFTPTSQGCKSNRPHGRNIRKRARAEQTGVVHWAQPEHEKVILGSLRSAFYRHESHWIHVRELSDLVGDARVKEHDILVQEFGKICRDARAVSIEDARILRQSHIDLSSHLLAILRRPEDKEVIEELGNVVDEIQDNAMTLSSIDAYRTRDSDVQDGTYRPSKKQRTR